MEGKGRGRKTCQETDSKPGKRWWLGPGCGSGERRGYTYILNIFSVRGEGQPLTVMYSENTSQLRLYLNLTLKDREDLKRWKN